jgi:hypothetical protein
VNVDRAANDHVGVVQLEQLAVLCFNLVGALVGPKLRDALAVRVENRVEEHSMAQLDQLSGQHRRRFLLHRTIGGVPLGFDRLETRDERNGVFCDVLDNVLLVSFYKTQVAVAWERSLIIDVVHYRQYRHA